MRTFLLLLTLFPLLIPSPVLAQKVATLGEKSIGLACANGADAANFDTLAQCSATSGNGTFQKAPLFVGKVTSPPYASTACDSAKDGMLQYTGTGGVVQYCNGSAWNTLGSSSGTGGQSMFSGWPDAIVCNVTNPAWGPTLFLAYEMPFATGKYLYGNLPNGLSNAQIQFNSSGNFASYHYNGSDGTSVITSNCNSSITNLIASGQAFNFVNGGANGAAAMADGTAGAPGLYFSADTNTGVYRPTTDNLAIATGGTERLRVTATGSVGVGTSAPTERLDLGGGNISMGYEQIQTTCNDSTWCFANCSSGKKVLGGGIVFTYTIPSGHQSTINGETGWRCYTNGGTANNVTCSAICANIR